jgi:wyosine [tRNA(Phe)-imidazoG37] synthetase (radical SAM superfamily)
VNVPLPIQGDALRRAFSSHPRAWRDFHYVYPVVSRRSKGLSIGINLNPDKACNFDCIYCSVERGEEERQSDGATERRREEIDLERVRGELEAMLDEAVSGRLWQDEKFADTPSAWRRLNDIAFSGDGEPTTYRHFDRACALAAEAKAQRGLDATKIVVITNATGLDRAPTRRALEILDRNQGEIWAKLDAGTEAYYQWVDRTKFPFAKVLRNILACGREREILIQSMFLSYEGVPVSDAEFAAYTDRLAELLRDGCRIKLVQLYTVARPPAERAVAALTNGQLDDLTRRLRSAIPSLAVEAYYGVV